MANFKYVTGRIRWAKVFQLVPNFNRDGFEWTFDFVPNDEALDVFKELKIEKKLKEKDGITFLRFTQKEKQANGKDNFPITVVDAANRPWDPQIVDGKVNNPIGNDSLVEVKFKTIDYGKAMPTGVYPQAIRVLDLKPYVRQEFAPLPEDNEYVQKAIEEFPPVAEVMQEIVDEDNDPLNIED
jgi:hypothetical protein